MTAVPLSARRASPWLLVLTGGLVAGTLDILYACIFWAVKADVPPERIFQSVAAGLLGEVSFAGGSSTAALGLALHYFIALAIAVAYFLIARRWPLLWQRPWLSGAAYGLLVYIVMNFVVVPLSAAASGPKDPLWISLTVVVHALFIGVPCALFARLALRQP